MRRTRVGIVVLAILAAARVAPSQQAVTGGVASQNLVASQVGAHVLDQGGNAIDAAIATAFALAVTHPTAGNIGGGGFLVFRRGDGHATTIDFRERAPAAVTPDVFLDESGAYSSRLHHHSYRSIGVPGTVAGLWLAHRRYGRRPWRELVAPAVALARDGFPVTRHLASSLARVAERLVRHASTRAVFYHEDGSTPRAGEILLQPELAATLERIAERGADGFYRGRTAELIVRQMERGGGLITRADLTSYRAVERDPVIGDYRGHTVISMGPPSSGGVTLVNMLNMLETFPVEREPAARVHLLAEIMRRGFADRARYLGDPDFEPGQPIGRLTSKGRARLRARDIDLAHASPSRLEGFGWELPEGDQTTHLSVVDAEQSAVALTYTLEYGYGSGIVVAGAGFLLNNEMGDFNPRAGLTTENGLIGSAPNLVEPGKRMLSSMTPTIVLDRLRRPFLVVGSPGGRTIINTVFQIISNVCDLGRPIQAAVELPRVHHQWFPDRIVIEKALDVDSVTADLERRGHALRRIQGMGAAECIQLRWRRGRCQLLPGIDPRAPDAGFSPSRRTARR